MLWIELMPQLDSIFSAVKYHGFNLLLREKNLCPAYSTVPYWVASPLNFHIFCPNVFKFNSARKQFCTYKIVNTTVFISRRVFNVRTFPSNKKLKKNSATNLSQWKTATMPINESLCIIVMGLNWMSMHSRLKQKI